METNELIPVQTFCINHQVEISFIQSLQQYGLVEIITIEENTYLSENNLTEVEKFIRMHYDLDINLEGIEAISHLVEKLKRVQLLNTQLQNRLRLYENIKGDL